MVIKQIPGNYSAANKEAVYHISEIPFRMPVRVAVIKSGNQLIGRKLFSETEVQQYVNIGPYVRKCVRPQPMHRAESGFYRADGRHVKVKIEAGYEDNWENGANLYSGETIYIAGTHDAPESGLLSDAGGVLRIAAGQHDEIPLVAEGKRVKARVRLSGKEGQRTIEIGGQDFDKGVVCPEGVCVFVLDADDVAARAGGQGLRGVERMDVEIVTANKSNQAETVAARRSYAIEGAGNDRVRLCWLNRYGSLDYYTFSKVHNETVYTSKRRVYTRNGYVVTGTEAETVRTVVSRCESLNTMRWLAQVAAATEVWEVKNGNFTPVDVEAAQVEVFGDVPKPLKLAIRGVKMEQSHNLI